MAITTETLRDAKYLLRDIEILTEGAFFDGTYVFRGQSDASWKLKSSFDRAYKDTLKNRNQMFNIFLD